MVNTHIQRTGIIHHSAVIHPDAIIGKNVTVGPFTYIDADVEIGDDTWIGTNVTIYAGSTIGNNCNIFPGAVIGAIPQDLKFEGEYTTVKIGNHTTIREYVTINRGTADAETTQIGNHCLLMAYVHIAHDCTVGNHVILANSVNLAGHVDIDDHAILEGLVAVQQFIRIGQHSFIAGGSLVRKNVPPYVKAAREPLAYVGVNKVGLSRRGYSQEEIHHIQDIYRHLFVTGQNTTQAVEAIKREVADTIYRREILAFINKATKKYGIMRGISTSKVKPLPTSALNEEGIKQATNGLKIRLNGNGHHS